jgi:hypothetical protein
MQAEAPDCGERPTGNRTRCRLTQIVARGDAAIRPGRLHRSKLTYPDPVGPLLEVHHWRPFAINVACPSSMLWHRTRDTPCAHYEERQRLQ